MPQGVVARDRGTLVGFRGFSRFVTRDAGQGAGALRPSLRRTTISLLTTMALLASLMALVAHTPTAPSAVEPSLIATRAANRICSDWPVVTRPGVEFLVFVPAGATVTVSGAADVIATSPQYDAAFYVDVSDTHVVNDMIGSYWGPPELNHQFSGSWTNNGAARDASVKPWVYVGTQLIT